MKNEGVMGLYKGVRPPLLASIPIYALSFYTWGHFQKALMEAGMTQESSRFGLV